MNLKIEPTVKAKHSWIEVTGEGVICPKCGEDSWYWYTRGNAWYKYCYPCGLARTRATNAKRGQNRKQFSIYGQPVDKELCCWEVVSAKARG